MSSARPPDVARSALDAWRRAYPVDPFARDDHVRAVNARYLGGTRLAHIEAIGRHFGQTLTTLVAPLVVDYESHPPELVSFDGAGNRVERIRFDEGYHEAGRLLWDAGTVQHAGVAGASFEQANLMYLAGHEGEMGHLCAATCTTGLIRVLRRSGDQELCDRFLPGLTATDYDDALRGAQFLTEVQGGSDVGANAAIAEPVGDGTYRITGEKWFCSVADADVFLVLARPIGAAPGTKGLGCFLIPRTVEGRPNNFSIRRLKDKLGTTSMASGEIDFEGSLGLVVGDLDGGFKLMVTGMLNSSRWLNAVGNLGMMRRAYLEASAYAVHRAAFGRPIVAFPLVRRQLAMMKAEWLASLHSTWLLTRLDEAVDVSISGGPPVSVEDERLHRFLVNANKLVVSVGATETVRQGIELLGGNGAIESFSTLPRLLRDCIVFEQWEGTHNVLAAQVLRDLGKLGLAGTVLDRIATMAKGIGDETLSVTAGRVIAAVERLAGRIARCVEDPAHGALHFRNDLILTVRALQAALLLEAAAADDGDVGRESAAAAEWIASTYLDPSWDASTDVDLMGRIDRLLGGDVTPGA